MATPVPGPGGCVPVSKAVGNMSRHHCHTAKHGSVSDQHSEERSSQRVASDVEQLKRRTG